MPNSQPNRRSFCASAAAALLTATSLPAQPAKPSSRPDVAAIDHDRILAAAAHALTLKPTPLTSLSAPHSPGSPQDYFSESAGFLAHRDAIFDLSRSVAALAAAFHITREEPYAAHAVAHLRAWFLDPSTWMSPSLMYAGLKPGDAGPRFEGILDTVFLAELAMAIPFLARSQALSPDDLAALKAWFASYLTWLTESRLAMLARDQKDHHATSWLLQTTSFARLTANEPVLAALRHRFKSVTLRAQVVTEGTFPNELTTAWPYRNSLLNLELLAACCLLLSSQFESLWEFELQDGPGLHTVIARHAPYIRDRNTWPYRADLDHFTDLPFRCSSLLFAARAYTQPGYAELWRTLNPDPTVVEIARSMPIAQPLLWTARP